MFAPPSNYGNNPGHPSQPILVHKDAVERERKRALANPFSAAEWDRKADARQAAWEASPFYEAFESLGVTPCRIIVDKYDG